MNNYQLYRDHHRLKLLKNNVLYWDVRMHISISGFGYTAITHNGDEYLLESKGLFFWRKIALLCNGDYVDSLKLYRAESSDIWLDSRLFICQGGEYLFSLDPQQQKNEHGHLLYQWRSDREDIEHYVMSYIVMYIQNNRYATSMGVA